MKWKKDNIYAFSLMIIIIDQVVKFLVRKNMHLFESISVIPSFFSLTYVENKGAAWGILEDATILLVMISFVAFFSLLKFIQEEKKWNLLKVSAFSFILGGIVGNLVDRLFYHSVTDYLDFSIFGYDFPVFNFADIMIVLGAVFLIIEMIRGQKHVY